MRPVESDRRRAPAGGDGEHGRGAAHGGLVALAFGALGIVYGDIGTSPLYAFRESFEHAELDVSQANAYGVASVVFWALVIVISVKYLVLVMRADNHGEGGILALTALLLPEAGLPTGHEAGDHRASACSAPPCSTATA